MSAPLHAVARALPAGRLPASTPALWMGLRRWWQTRRQRQALRRLDARLLRDIGVSRDAAAREAARPFWDL